MSVFKLVEDINSAISSAKTLHENERSELLRASQDLTLALESPMEATMRICFAVWTGHSRVSIAKD